MILSLLPLVALSVPLASQAEVASNSPYKVSLSAESYVRFGEPVQVKLSLSALRKCSVPQGWFTGMSFRLKVNGKDLGLLGDASEGGHQKGVPLVAGTKLEVSLPIRSETLSKKLSTKLSTKVEPGAILNCELSIPGEPAALTKFRVVREPRPEDLGKLDLSRTKVALVTNFGTMVLSFRPDKAPKTVENFVKLSLQHFYDKTKFHRVIPGFMIQGGDPNSKNDNPDDDGMGDPGYKIDAEFNDLKHVRGVISMARSADPNSAGSQFFICHAAAPHLDGKYTAFGKLEEGLDTLDRICKVPLGFNRGGQKTRPTKDVVVLRTVVLPVWK